MVSKVTLYKTDLDILNIALENEISLNIDYLSSLMAESEKLPKEINKREIESLKYIIKEQRYLLNKLKERIL